MSRLSSRAALFTAAATLALVAAAPALAQDDDVQEVIVTIQKREQAITEVPAALTAYGGDYLQDIGVTDFEQLSAFVPGFEVQNQSANNPGFVMRGITSDALEAYNEPRVSVFQDGVSISRSSGAFVELYDLQRVEVAKGPQSTLFGRGALIGAVNIIQNKAGLGGFDWAASASAGRFDARMFDGMINIPLGEMVALRVSGRIKERDGYVPSLYGTPEDFNSQDTNAYRVSLAVAPSDTISADLIYNYQEDSTAATAFKAMRFLPTDPITGAPLGTTSAFDGAALGWQPISPGVRPLGIDRTVEGVTLLIDWELSPNWTLSSITAAREFEASEGGDADGTSLPLLAYDRQTSGDMFSQELRLRYDAGGEFAWFAGVNYFDEEGLDGSPIQWDERVALAQLAGQLHMGGFGSGLATNHPAPYAYFGDSLFINPLLLQGVMGAISGGNLAYNYFGPDTAFLQALAGNLKPSHLEQQYNRQALTSWDVFTDFTWRANEQWEFSLGLRYTEDEKDVFYSSQVNNGRSILGGILGAAQLAASGNPVDVFTAQLLLSALTSPTAVTDPVGLLTPLYGLTFQPTLNNGSTETISASDDGVTWRLTALYRATEDLNFYANYGRGRRPLAVAALSPSTPYGSARFDFVPAETVDSYEVGFKGSFFDRALRLDGALYHYKYENFQTIVQVGTTFITSNAGEASATGVEMQGVWTPTDNFSFFGTYAYNNGRFEGGAYDGNRFRLSPDHAFSLGMDVQWPFLGGEVYFRPTYTWQSKVFFDDNNDEAFFQQAPPKFVADNIIDEFQESYGLLNARLGFSPGEGNWEVELYGDNLLDYRYVIDAGNTGDAFGMATWIPGPPRMVGVSVRIRR